MPDKPKKMIDKKVIKDLAILLDELDLTEISYSDGKFSVSVSKGAVASYTSQLSKNEDDNLPFSDKEDYENDPRVIKSPMVGTVYLQPEPGANKFVNAGDQVKQGQTILIVEAMKTMNPIESSLQGKVLEIFVDNEQAVEFGQPLMLIG